MSCSYSVQTTCAIVQFGGRQTEDLKVPGSNPETSCEFCIISGLGNIFFQVNTFLNFVSAVEMIFLIKFSFFSVLMFTKK